MQVARLRRAWLSLREAASESARLRATPEEANADLDALLPTKDLAKARSAFWARHHFNLPAYALPSDQMLSRVLREFNMKLLTVRPLDKVQTQLAQISPATASKKGASDLNGYLINLRTLMVAYAIAGSRPASGKVQPTAETENSDPTDWMECPFEVVMRYYLRAEQKAMEVQAAKGPGPALAWLKARDHDDRSAWVEAHRQWGLSVGAAISSTTNKREATWLTDTEIRNPVHTARPLPGPTGAPKRTVQTASASSGWGASSSNVEESPTKMPKNFTRELPNGKQFCWAWNREAGGCREPCPNRRMHLCGFYVRKGRACGMKNHRFCEHGKQEQSSFKPKKRGNYGGYGKK